MTDLWYYAEDGQARGPLSLAELVSVLAKLGDPRRVLVWRDGFNDWKAVEEVREVAQQLFRPSALHAEPQRVPGPMITKPSRTGHDPAIEEQKAIVSEPSGIGGWLALLAFGQVVGLIRLLIATGQYYVSSKNALWKFPAAAFGEAFLNALLILLIVCTTILLFRHSHKFPRVFIAQMFCVVAFPFIDFVWSELAVPLSLAKPIPNLLTFNFEPKQLGQIGSAVISAIIWIPYLMRSRRVANTFKD